MISILRKERKSKGEFSDALFTYGSIFFCSLPHILRVSFRNLQHTDVFVLHKLITTDDALAEIDSSMSPTVSVTVI